MIDRSKTLRKRVLDRQMKLTARVGDNLVIDAKSLKETESINSWQLRCGLRTKARLSNLKFEIDELELLAGRIIPKQVEKEHLDKANKYLSNYEGHQGQTGHCQPNYSEILDLGIDALISNIREKMRTSQTQKVDTYQSFIYALEGLSIMIENNIIYLERAIIEAPSERKIELEKILNSCKRISHQKPENFRDAIQLIWFVMIGIMIGDNVHLTGPGRLDRALFKFYNPKEKTESLELIEGLYFHINSFQQSGLAYAVMVGGRDKTGKDMTNELSYLCMQAIRRTALTYPTVGLCWNDQTPDDLFELTCELISKGYATPAIFGDDVIAKGMKIYGVPDEDAYDYINSACVEITPCGASNVWVASPYFSLCKLLLKQIDIAVQENIEYSSFEAFLKHYFQTLEIEIGKGVNDQIENREHRAKFGGKPLQSVFTRDCIKSGRDIDNAGAVYNWVECSFVGTANLVDSLIVIKNTIFKEKKQTLAKLKSILDKNFEDNEDLRLNFLNNYPKYGNNCDETNGLIKIIVDKFKQECAKYKIPPDNSHFIPGMFCWIMHQILGGECGATPDGRNAKIPFADGAGPAQGRERQGPTSGILSVTSWDHSAFIGGSAYNMKFNKTLFKEYGVFDKFKIILKSFLISGGFEVQVNVIDNEILKKAKEDPENYRDIVVRIGGYTDYFINLSPEMQDEVLSRTGFNNL